MMSGKATVFLICCCILTSHPLRDNIEYFICQVSGAHHKSFPTQELAAEYYLGAKHMDKVFVVRNPSDDEIYSPRDKAMQ